MNAADYSEMLKVRLPQGEAWPTSDQTDGATGWDMLIDSFSHEPKRIDDDLMLLHRKVVPDNEDTDLDMWEEVLGAPEENLTSDQRLARIRSILRGNGEIDRLTLEQVIQRLAGDDSGVKLINRAFPTTGAGVLAAGCGIGHQPHSWALELMPNIAGGTTPDDMNPAWAGVGVVVDNQHPSPVTLQNTAADVSFSTAQSRAIAGTANNDILYVSFWVMIESAPEDFSIFYLHRNGLSFSTPVTYTLQPDIWYRIQYEASVGTGGGSPNVVISTGTNSAARLSWFVAGIRDYELEARIRALFPMHTRGVIGVQGEYETLLSHDVWEVGI